MQLIAKPSFTLHTTSPKELSDVIKSIANLGESVGITIEELNTAFSAAITNLDTDYKAADKILSESIDTLNETLTTFNGEYDTVIASINKKISELAAKTTSDIAASEKRSTEHAIRMRQSAVDEIILTNPTVCTTKDVEALKGLDESFEEIFNTWERFSHVNGLRPGIASELNGWSYDKVNDRVVATINSSSSIGFVSKDSYTDYVFEIELSSNISDDDWMGAVLGFAKTPDGKEHSLLARRSSGANPIVQIGMNIQDANKNGYKTIVIPPIAHGLTGKPNNPSWVNCPGPCKLKVTRTGDVFKVEHTQMGSAVYVPSATQIFDLNDYPDMSMFKGASPYGYCSLSQQGSTFKTLRRPTNQSNILDVEAKVLWSNDGIGWTSRPATDLTKELVAERFYLNTVTRELYFSDHETELHLVGGSTSGSGDWNAETMTTAEGITGTSTIRRALTAKILKEIILGLTSSYIAANGGTITNGDLNFIRSLDGITWNMNTDGAGIRFKSDSDQDTDSYLEFYTMDNSTEYFRWGHLPSGSDALAEYLTLKLSGLDLKVGSYKGNGSGLTNLLGSMVNGVTKDQWRNGYRSMGSTTLANVLQMWDVGSYRSGSSNYKWSNLPQGCHPAFNLHVDSIGEDYRVLHIVDMYGNGWMCTQLNYDITSGVTFTPWVKIATGGDITKVLSDASEYADTKHKEAVDEIILTSPLIAKTADVDKLKGEEESFEEVFNKWKRISHYGANRKDANVGEMNAWKYDAASNQIRQPLNSVTLVGLVSPEGYTDYTFEVELSTAIAGDDDFIGVIFGFATTSDGKEHTLSALRSPCVVNGGMGNPAQMYGQGIPWQVGYNICSADIAESRLFNPTIAAGLTRPGAWTTAGPVRVKVVRTGDVIVVSTAQFKGNGSYDPKWSVTIDLNDYPELAMFKTKSPIGYCNLSQPGSTYKTLQKPSDLTPVLDIEAMVNWTHVNGAWASKPITDITTVLKAERFYLNQVTKVLHYTDMEHKPTEISVGESVYSPPVMPTFNLARPDSSIRFVKNGNTVSIYGEVVNVPNGGTVNICDVPKDCIPKRKHTFSVDQGLMGIEAYIAANGSVLVTQTQTNGCIIRFDGNSYRLD